VINEDKTVLVNLEAEAEAKTGHPVLVTLFTFTLFSSYQAECIQI